MCVGANASELFGIAHLANNNDIKIIIFVYMGAISPIGGSNPPGENFFAVSFFSSSMHKVEK